MSQEPLRVLVTGAAGIIGSAFWKRRHGEFSLRLTGLHTDGLAGAPCPSMQLDVADYAACLAACMDTDVVLHLAGVPHASADFDAQLLQPNIIGTHNVFRAAQAQGVKRVVFASSAQAIEGYPLDMQVQESMPARPANMYGASKAFGEGVACAFAHQHGMTAIAVRIANVTLAVAMFVALFGTPLEDLNTGDIPKFLAGLQQGSAGLGSFAGASTKAADQVANSNPIERLKRTLEGGLANLIDTEAINGPLNRIVDMVGGLLDSLKGVAEWVSANQGWLGPIAAGITAMAVAWGAYVLVTQGIPALRHAIGEWCARRYGIAVDPESEILPVNGSREALFSFAQTVIDPSRAGGTPIVVSPNPFYQIYEGAAYLAGAEPRFLNNLPDNGFAFDYSQLSEAELAS